MYKHNYEALEDQYYEWLEENCACESEEECICMTFNDWLEMQREEAAECLADEIEERCV